MTKYWTQFSKSELDAMHGVEKEQEGEDRDTHEAPEREKFNCRHCLDDGCKYCLE